MRTIFFLLIVFNCYILIKSRPLKFKKSFKQGERINLISGTVNSFKTQIPYDLYYLDICAPEDVFLM